MTSTINNKTPILTKQVDGARVTHDMVGFTKTKDDLDGYNYTTELTLKAVCRLSDGVLKNEDSLNQRIEEHVREKLLEQIDHMVYSKFREEQNRQLSNFLFELSKYKCDFSDNYRIPGSDIHSLESKLKSIIVGYA